MKKLSEIAASPETSDILPVEPLTTTLVWANLVLPLHTRERLKEVRTWLSDEQTLRKDWGLDERLKPGYRVLFFGAKGTGKKLAAALLGKATGRAVYRIDLWYAISAYRHETRERLAALLALAQKENALLYFDHAEIMAADLLWASQSDILRRAVCNIMQGVAEYPGVVIFASNLESEPSASFAEHFESIIRIPIPGPEERLRILENVCDQVPMSPFVSLKRIADEHQLTGGRIVEVIRNACLTALGRGMDRMIDPQDIDTAIQLYEGR